MFHWPKKGKPGSGAQKQAGEKSHKVRTIVLVIVGLIVAVTAVAFLKAGITIHKISDGNIFGSIVRSLPGVDSKLQGEDEGRINILLLGMRGEHVEGGGLLADTIMLASIFPEQNTVSLVSIPRDLFVMDPVTSNQEKINAVHLHGEDKGRGEGLKAMEQVISEVSGQTVPYAVSIDFKGFEELVDALGGIEVTLNEPFSEPLQFHEEHVCDPNVFTVPSGNFETKYNGEGRIKAQYPLCYNSDEECGGVFELPAGTQTLNGENALCYVRSRVTSDDFERAKRQRAVLGIIKDKLLAAGTLTDFGKVNDILNALGDNVRTDMAPWEMKRAWEIAQTMQSPEIIQKGLDNSEEGLLYAPEVTEEHGYILLPRGDSYDRIHELFSSIVPKNE